MDLQKIQCSNKCGRWCESNKSICRICSYVVGLGETSFQEDPEMILPPITNETIRNPPHKTLSETDMSTKGDGWKFNLFNRRSESRIDKKSSTMNAFMKILLLNSHRSEQEMFFNVIESINKSQLDDPSKLSQQYHDYYSQIHNRLYSNSKFRNAINNDSFVLGSCIERLLFAKIKSKLLNVTKNRNYDSAYSFRIHHLSWVNESHLQIPKPVHSEPSMSLLFCAAQSALIEMMERNSPSGKLISLSKCCRKLFALINEFNLNRPASADDFLPLFVFTILKTNPQDIKSNIDLINLFGQENVLDAGEPAYYFTTLTCAIEFIENTSHQSFNISPDEYQSLIISSKTNIELIMENVYSRLDALKLKKEQIRQKISQFHQMIFINEPEKQI